MAHSFPLSKKWFTRQTGKDIILPVITPIAAQRLRNALTSPIIISKGLLYAVQKYTGHVNEHGEIDIELTFRGRPNVRYTMHGTLLEHPKGCRLIMTVSDKSSLLLMLLSLSFMIFMDPKQFRFAISLAVVFMPFLIISLIWHRNSAMRSISELIYKIASGLY